MNKSAYATFVISLPKIALHVQVPVGPLSPTAVRMVTLHVLRSKIGPAHLPHLFQFRKLHVFEIADNSVGNPQSFSWWVTLNNKFIFSILKC